MVSLQENTYGMVDNFSEDGLAEIINYLDRLWNEEQAKADDETKIEYKMIGLIDFESIAYEL